MTRTHRPISLAAILCLALATAAAADLRADVERLARISDLGAAVVGVSVREAGPGTSIVELNAETLLIPASNMKLLTTGAALHHLGPDFKFQTRLLLDGDRLIVVGDGDPAFADPELLAVMTSGDVPGLDVESFLQLWLQPVVDAGITQISELVIDDRVFDREFVHPTWPRDQLNRRYCAQVAGLNFHLNILRFYPEPRAGRPSLTRREPQANWVEITNNATSRTGVREQDNVWIARKLGTNELTFYGNVKHAYQSPVPVTIDDPPQFFAQLLARRLEAAGVSVGDIRICAPNEPESTGQLIAPVVYSPISTVIARCNQDSQNLYAESLLKRLGHAMTGQPGSWLNGASILRHAVHQRLDDPGLSSKLQIADGSGLSRDNRVAPATLTAWLNSFNNDERLGSIFIESLAVGGESGTLRNRLRTADTGNAVVQAKSGYINQVSCLSGYITMPDGRRRCFTILINDLQAPVSRAKKLQDDIVRAIAEDMAAAPAQLGSD